MRMCLLLIVVNLATFCLIWKYKIKKTNSWCFLKIPNLLVPHYPKLFFMRLGIQEAVGIREKHIIERCLIASLNKYDLDFPFLISFLK